MWGDLGGMAVVGFRGNKHKEWSMWKGKKGGKKKVHKLYELCAARVSNTHTSRQAD